MLVKYCKIPDNLILSFNYTYWDWGNSTHHSLLSTFSKVKRNKKFLHPKMFSYLDKIGHVFVNGIENFDPSHW